MQDGGELVGLWEFKIVVVGVAESEELGNRNICRTGTLAVRRIALLVGKKSGKIFFLTWQKLRGKRGRKVWRSHRKKLAEKLVKNITFLQRQQINQLDEMKNAVITVTIRSLKSG